MRVDENFGPDVTMMRVPHLPHSVDHRKKTVHVAATRNPNQIYDLMPVDGLMARSEWTRPRWRASRFFPVRTTFLPGCFYIHDLAMIGDCLHANSVGQNSVVKLCDSRQPERVWWPKCIESSDGPRSGQTISSSILSLPAPQLKTLFFLPRRTNSAS